MVGAPVTLVLSVIPIVVGVVFLLLRNGDPFFSQVLVGVAGALDRSELDLTLMLASSERGQARLDRLLRSRRSEGLMLMALRGDDPLNRLVAEADLPVDVGGRPLRGEARWYGCRTALLWCANLRRQCS